MCWGTSKGSKNATQELLIRAMAEACGAEACQAVVLPPSRLPRASPIAQFTAQLMFLNPVWPS